MKCMPNSYIEDKIKICDHTGNRQNAQKNFWKSNLVQSIDSLISELPSADIVVLCDFNVHNKG